MLFLSQHNTYRSFQLFTLSLIQCALLFSCAEVQIDSSHGFYPSGSPANGVLNDQVSDAFDFAGINLFGLSLTDARLNFDSAHPNFLYFAVDLGVR